MAVAAFDRLAGFRIDAERRAEKRVLDVVDGDRVAGQQDVDEAGADEVAEMRTPPVWTTTGPATNGDAAAARFQTSRIMAAMRATPVSTRRSDEISFVMNAKP